MNTETQPHAPSIPIQTAYTIENAFLCREHCRLTCRVPGFPDAQLGQFVHMAPENVLDNASLPERAFSPENGATIDHGPWVAAFTSPMLRRAFSIAGLRRTHEGVDIDVIYRVVGKATRWMESLRPGDGLSLMGPLGNCFPIPSGRTQAWLVAGGVGLPPMLWLAEALQSAGKETIAFCGAQTGDLLALEMDGTTIADPDARCATLCAVAFAAHGARTVVSTDDGSLGFRGHIGDAMCAYHRANPVPAEALVVYTCGPERMMEFVARYCIERGIECYVCMERAMACGTGLCQSCVVPVSDPSDAQGWRYRLCCTEGPIFDAGDIIWEPRDRP